MLPTFIKIAVWLVLWTGILTLIGALTAFLIFIATYLQRFSGVPASSSQSRLHVPEAGELILFGLHVFTAWSLLYGRKYGVRLAIVCCVYHIARSIYGFIQIPAGAPDHLLELGLAWAFLLPLLALRRNWEAVPPSPSLPATSPSDSADTKP